MTDQAPPPILLLKTRSSPHDGYDEFFSAQNYTPTFVPVLSHNFHSENLAQIRALFESGHLNPGPERRYGGLIFTSQRAVEAFADMLAGLDQSLTATASNSLPLYTVGPATARSLTTLRDTHLPHATIHGADTGNGENLATFILDHYNSLFPSSASELDTTSRNTANGRKPPLLFLVGETRRDIIPRILMGEPTPISRRIGVEEVVVYETGVVTGFESEFEGILENYNKTAEVVWVVVFSPTGCDAMVRVLRREAEKWQEGEGRRLFVATIGPTTRNHLVKECGFQPDVCAARPSPEGVGEGITEFLKNWGCQLS
ncbi:tetrapyrrole biosynthesis, uroporphyrinogen III synthase [Aspergillus granulosus]|uniref:Tetrapyrrole biosynthesis, uroporphyrinogen III synthase n=1 Tax=Aspergillus granulosus TaxID=176169 RepID=A0ABR4GWY8_9EURO